MPRPKRSKATPSLTSPRIRRSKVKESTDVASVTSRSTFNDLYDVSDNEDERRLSVMDNGKDKEKKEALVSPMARNFLEMGREQYANIEKGHTGKAVNISVTDARPSSLPSSPTFDTGRKEEPTPTRESLALAMGNLRTQNNSVDLDFLEIDSSNQKRSDDSIALNSNVGTKTRELRRSVRQADIQAYPNALTTNTQCKLDHETEFSFDISTPIKTPNTIIFASSILTSSSKSKSKKRKLSEVQVPQSSFEPSPPVLLELDDIVPSTNPDNRETRECIEERREDILPSVEDRSPTPQKIREIMAPPHSSSSILSSPVAHSKTIRASSRNLRSLRVKTPMRIGSDSEISSPPSLTHSPDLPSPTTIKSRDKKLKPSHFSMPTAQLKALLPRRRRRIARDICEGINSDNEINTSGLASDEDELTHLIMGPHARNRNTKSSNAPAARASVLRKKPIRMSNGKTSTLKTYGSIDKSSHSDLSEETEDDHQNKSPIRNINNVNEKPQELGKKLLGKELKKAVQKFKEVDNWALDFEDTFSSSLSPIDAR